VSHAPVKSGVMRSGELKPNNPTKGKDENEN